MAPDGGLYVPETLPALPPRLLTAENLSYADLAEELLSLFFPEFDRRSLRAALEASCARFDSRGVAPLVHQGSYHFLELFHGPTLAFKDLALTLMGSLMNLARERSGEEDELLILVATSGDTGKAALAGFSDMPGIRVVVFYPARGVSPVQKLQMVSHQAANVTVLGIEGSFDDAQQGVKALFADESLAELLRRRHRRLSSANSINIARLLPQLVYYVKAWRDLGSAGMLGPSGEMDVVVPTGNFGNILAAYYGKAMGLPIRHLVCASNRNRVLADFLASHVYEANRPFHVTTSPSMDILVSSNLERMLFEATHRDWARTSELMSQLGSRGRFSITEREAEAFADFRGGWADDEAAASAIRRLFEATGYLIDPHTAVALSVAESWKTKNVPELPTLVAATASPFKFPLSVARALGMELESDDELKIAEALGRYAGLELPPPIAELGSKPILHPRVIAPGAMKSALLELVGQV